MEPVVASASTPSPERRRAPLELVREPLDFTGSPYDALAALRDEPLPFALVGRWAGGGAVVGASPRRVLDEAADPLRELDRLPGIRAGTAGAVGGGWFGYLGYGLGSRLEALPPRPPRPAPLPDFHLAYYDCVLRQEPGGRWWLEGLEDPGEGGDLRDRMATIAARLRLAAVPRAGEGRARTFAVTAAGPAGHRWAVAEAVERIAAGDLFQVNLGLRLEAAGRLDPLDLFIRASAALRPAYGAVFGTPWGGIVSLSPELFLRREGSAVRSGPIKGTVPRPPGFEAAVRRQRLLASGKDAAEHVMIVDLMRNDLGRVCEYGTVTREARRRIEPHPGVWHLVSDVTGVLRPGVGDGRLLAASFPPGSVTGAPKVQSMHLISELESSGRELYTGALGFASPAAGLELSVAIRTFELTHERVWLGAGGGIVADSDPHAELDEALAKAAPLVAAAGGRIATAPAGARMAAGAPSGVRDRGLVAPRLRSPAHRPDPGRGIMETVLVRGGSPVALSDHLARLSASARLLYGARPPDWLADAARAHARGPGDVRLRVHVRPDGRRLQAWCELADLPAPEPPPLLVPVIVPGGLGAHKWRDRRLLDELTAARGGVPLILDSSGEVLEAAWGNVWLVLDGEHRTPPADGRLLPGIARRRRFEALRSRGITSRVGPVGLDDLTRGELYLTSALRASCPVRLADSALAQESIASACAQRTV